MKKIFNSPLTNRIYLANAKVIDEEKGIYKCTGNKTDVTDEVLSSAFQYFENECKSHEEEGVFTFTYPVSDYVLIMKHKEKNNG